MSIEVGFPSDEFNYLSVHEFDYLLLSVFVRCVGSTQHLKNKYGSAYVLEVKLHSANAEPVHTSYVNLHVDSASSLSSIDRLRRFISQLFPHAVEIECFGERATYKIPKADVGMRVSKSFAALEEGLYLMADYILRCN